MKISLINVPGVFIPFPHIGIGYLTAIASQAGHEVKTFDYPQPSNNYEYFINNLINWRPEIIGFSLNSFSNLDLFKKSVDLLKDNITRVKLITGGPLCTILGKEVFGRLTERIDAIFLRESEISFLTFINKVEKNDDYSSIPGIITQSNISNEIENNDFFVSDLDSLPFPVYSDAKRGLKDYPLITIRGCPYECIFCLSPFLWKNTYRTRSSENVINEIMEAKKKYRFHRLQILDDNFTLDYERAIVIFENIIEKRLNIDIELPNGIRADTVDFKLARLMKRAGVKRVSIGIESMDEKIFQKIKKGENLAEIVKAINLLKKADIEVRGLMIIGLPGSNKNTELGSIAKIKKLGIKSSWLIAIAFPHTELFSWVQKNAVFLHDNINFRHDHWSPLHNIGFETKEFSANERRKMFIIANLKTKNFEFFSYGETLWRKTLNRLYYIFKYNPSSFPFFIIWGCKALYRKLK